MRCHGCVLHGRRGKHAVIKKPAEVTSFREPRIGTLDHVECSGMFMKRGAPCVEFYPDPETPGAT